MRFSHFKVVEVLYLTPHSIPLNNRVSENSSFNFVDAYRHLNFKLLCRKCVAKFNTPKSKKPNLNLEELLHITIQELKIHRVDQAILRFTQPDQGTDELPRKHCGFSNAADEIPESFLRLLAHQFQLLLNLDFYNRIRRNLELELFPLCYVLYDLAVLIFAQPDYRKDI